jgi:thiamine kinase-like enzyme
LTADIDLARKRLASLPGFGADAARTAEITRLAGMTNLVFKVEAEGRNLLFRLPGAGTETYINRKVEAVNARAAATAGVSPEVIHFGEDGVMLTRFLDNAITMSPKLFRERSGAVERAALAFRQLHDKSPEFAFHFELFKMIDDYLAVLDKLRAQLPEGYHRVVVEATTIRHALAQNSVALKPCHCDPLCENFLDSGTRMWIVDWEYSGMNDPMWDLGDLSVEAGFDASQDRRLIDTYFERPASAFDFGRMVIYKAMCDLLWTLWGLIQHANKNPAEDFWAYSINRFERCKALMRSPDFAGHLDAVRRG